MTFRVGTNCILLETVLDSNFEPIIHAGERVEISDPNYMTGPSEVSEYCGIRNKIDERAVVHCNKLRLARGRPMRILR
jgi:hypothetical protein